MTSLEQRLETRGPVSPRWSNRVSWFVVLAAFVAFWQFGETYAGWAFAYPKQYALPAARWISNGMKWLIDEAGFGLFSFVELTRFVSALINIPYQVALSLLSTGFLQGQGSNAVQIVPPLSWIAVIGTIVLLGWYAGGRRLALLVGACFGFLAVFGQWNSAMVTLASIIVAVPLGVGAGLLLGIAAYRWPAVDRVLRPILDLMQTIPVFAYLVPILFLFGFGPTAALIATLIYAMPPMVRITQLGLQSVPSEIHDLGKMVGCTRRQMTWRVLVPSVKGSLMVGVNQVIMLSLNMVIIASMIGAGGLGFDVLAALRRLDIGGGLEAGLAIVAMAIALDRLSQALALKVDAATASGKKSLVGRHPYLLAALGLVVLTSIAGLTIPAVQQFPQALQITTGPLFANVVAWINVHFFDVFETVKNAILLNVLVPTKRMLGGMPWLGVTLLLFFVGWRLSGLRLAFLVAVLSLLIAATGQWEKATITVYLCGISVIVAMMIGLPVGILAAQRDATWRWVQVVTDLLQTLPSFVYLMPVVMLFRVGDFTAMIAVVAFAVAPAIRYTAIGLRGVDPKLIEAGLAMGCTPWQLLTKIKLKLALPQILLGINQTIMLALSMLVITALVGTRDLGQEVYIALTKADTGRGVVAGLAVAFIAIIADRLISAGATRLRARMGV